MWCEAPIRREAFEVVSPSPWWNTFDMRSQKNLSHSSLMTSAAPPRREVLLPRASLVVVVRFLEDVLGSRASSLDGVMAARGGLEGGDGRPEEGTSGIPLDPGSPGSAVVQALERARGVDEVAAGKDVGRADDVLAVITTVIIHGIFHGRHFELVGRGGCLGTGLGLKRGREEGSAEADWN